MNETELLDSLHDANILAIKQDGRRVIIEINYAAEWEPREEVQGWTNLSAHYKWSLHLQGSCGILCTSPKGQR